VRMGRGCPIRVANTGGDAVKIEKV
jgi:hypothetical protein